MFFAEENIDTKTNKLLSFLLQGRHVKTGQLAAIKVMDVTGVMYPPLLHP